MNIRYFGPLDGHNIKELVHTLERIKDMKGPRILHIHTIKGKGYEPAEEKPTIWHAPGRFNKDTGERGGGSGEKAQMCPPRFQDVFGETLVELARRNPRIMGVRRSAPLPPPCREAPVCWRSSGVSRIAPLTWALPKVMP